MKRTPRSLLQSEKGMASIEMVPMIMLFLFLMTYTLGAFGIVHSAIKQSISARTYAFETFRNRTNLTYHRDIVTNAGAAGVGTHYSVLGNRQHLVIAENNSEADRLPTTERPIRVGIPMAVDSSTRNDNTHNIVLHEKVLVGQRNGANGVAVNPVWIKVKYGICVTAACGPPN